jgi:hypothetical protein
LFDDPKQNVGKTALEVARAMKLDQILPLMERHLVIRLLLSLSPCIVLFIALLFLSTIDVAPAVLSTASQILASLLFRIQRFFTWKFSFIPTFDLLFLLLCCCYHYHCGDFTLNPLQSFEVNGDLRFDTLSHRVPLAIGSLLNSLLIRRLMPNQRHFTPSFKDFFWFSRV